MNSPNFWRWWLVAGAVLAVVTAALSCTPPEQQNIENERYFWGKCHNVLQVATTSAETTYVLFGPYSRRYAHCVDYMTPKPKL